MKNSFRFLKSLAMIVLLVGVVVVGGCGQQGASELSVNIPSRPTDAYLRPDNSKIFLHFTGTNEANIQGYNIYRSNGSGSGFALAGFVTQESYYTGYSYYDNDLINGNNYYYKVTSVTENGVESEFSDEVNGIPLRCVYVSWPTTNRLNEVCFVSENNGWAVGDSKTILHYTGTDWQTVAAPVESDPYASFLNAVFFTSSTDGWICTGLVGEIWHYDGNKWSVFAALKDVSHNSNVTLNDIYFVSSDDGWVGGEGYDSSGYVAHYNGITWESVPLPSGTRSIQNISFSSSTNGWAIDESGNVLYYDGVSWSIVKSLGGSAVNGFCFDLPPSYLWVGGNGGSGLSGRYYDGEDWYYLSIGGFEPMFDIYMLSSLEGWAVGTEQIWRCWDGTWYEIDNPEEYSLSAVFFTSRTKGWGVSYSGKVYKFE
ncbi:MAG: hypothetical protein ABIH69_03655 [bacterium]